MSKVLSALALSVCVGVVSYAQNPGPAAPAQMPQAPPAPAQGNGQSPASERPPQTATPQEYPAEQVLAGQTLFSAQCGFCHGRDAGGGETGPDLTRSAVVAEDVRGDKIGPLARNGRVDKGMPAFNLSPADLTAIVAFIHDQKTKAESEHGGRRAVELADLQTGDAEKGRQYFNGSGGCARCHSPSGDLAGVAKKREGLALLQRMLYPAAGRGGGPAPAPASVTVTLGSGQTISGKLAYRDEFVIALTDASGWYRSWAANQVTFTVNDPLDAHTVQLGKYTDDDMHNVLAYLQTLQ
jgi:cytochrome c oxidase cbb3-type subunit III